MTEANPPQENQANDDLVVKIPLPPLEKGRCRSVIPVTVCKHSVSNKN